MKSMPSVFFHTFGCKVNQYESESLRGRLARAGYRVSSDFSSSDVCVVNSCSVTAEADRKCRQFVRKVLQSNPAARVLVTGCFATRDPQAVRAISPRIEVFTNQEKDLIPSMVSGCSLASGDAPLLNAFSGHTRAFVKVKDGCDAPCTYCIIPKVRPKMESRPVEEVCAEVRGLVGEGYKEIVLTGIRLGSYGLSSSGGRVGRVRGALAGLLRELSRLPGDFRVRLSSLEITEVSDELLEFMKNSHFVCRHFHLPLQSGDDAVLKRMGRWYDSKFYAETVARIREALPDAGVTADVIVGFPGETEERFENTRALIEKNLNGLHVFPYSSRPGTPSARLRDAVTPSEIGRRVQALRDLDARLRKSFQARFAGSERSVLAELDGGFTDNGIRVPLPLPFPRGTLAPLTIPSPA
jgi:threonylcarbamoyladenosine tRNA methylthiotransferase MtaB